MPLTPAVVSAFADSAIAVVTSVALYATWRGVSSWKEERKSSKKSEMAEKVFFAAKDVATATLTAPGMLHEPNAIDLNAMKRKHPQAGEDIILLFPLYRLERAHHAYKTLRALEEHVRSYFGEEAHAALTFLLRSYKERLRGAAETADLFEAVYAEGASPEEARRATILADLATRREKLAAMREYAGDHAVEENRDALVRLLAPYLHLED